LGIPGYKEFKIMLSRDIFSPSSYLKENIDPLSQTEITNQDQRIIDSNIEVLTDLKTMIKSEMIEKAVNFIDKSKYIFSFGVGFSKSVAFDFYHKMSRLGYLCGFAKDYYMQLIAASNLTSGMTAMFISHSGTTASMVKAAKISKNNGAYLITITSNPDGDIGALSDCLLLIPFSEPLQRYGASSTRIAQLTIVDMIFSKLIRKHPSRAIKNLEKTNF
jgi:DNA-binding MurR/RpiR family transcriptional regulator